MIYLDHAASAPLSQQAEAFIINHIKNYLPGNPNSPHYEGIIVRSLLKNTEDLLRETLGIEGGQLIWTGSGSYANQLICDLIFDHKRDFPSTTCLYTGLEHKSILDSCTTFSRRHIQLPIDKNGITSFTILNDSQNNGYYFMPVLMVNNETGILSPVQSYISQLEKYVFSSWVHVDVCQAIGRVKINVKELGCDSITGSAHKFGGPKGVGFLWIKDTHAFRNIPHQGTPNTIGILGLHGALLDLDLDKISIIEEKQEIFLEELTGYLEPGKDFVQNFSSVHRVPGILSLAFPGIDNETLQFLLSDKGVMVSTGSACNTGPSYVLENMGLPKDIVENTIRISFDYSLRVEEIITACEIIAATVKEEQHGS